MPFGADDRQATCIFHFRGELDVSTAARHVGSDGDHPRAAGFCHDFRFPGMQLRIEDIVVDPLDFKHPAQQFADLHRCRPYKHRPSGFKKIHDLLDHRIVFLALGFIDQVLIILAHHRFVGWDHYHLQLINVPQLSCFGFSSSRHPCQLVIHPEVVLKRDSGKGLRGRFHLHMLLGFYGLVQTVRIPAPLQNTARLLINNLYLIVHHHIFHILLKHSIGFDQLVDGMNPLRFHRIILQKSIFLLHQFFRRQLGILKLRNLGSHIGKYEKRGILKTSRNQVNSLIGQLHRILLLIDDEEERIGHNMHIFAVVLHIEVFSSQQTLLDPFLTQKLDERLVLGQSLVGP